LPGFAGVGVGVALGDGVGLGELFGKGAGSPSGSVVSAIPASAEKAPLRRYFEPCESHGERDPY
jgi:hypothetical protein